MKITQQKSDAIKTKQQDSSLSPFDNIVIYLDRLYKVTKDERLVDNKVRLNIEEKIEGASKITGINMSDLLIVLDFKQNDLTTEYLESFLAELRSIFWLQNFGFSDIIPLKAKKKRIQPDFQASYDHKKCVVEVFCLTQEHEQKVDPKYKIYINFDPNFRGSKFGRDFISQAKKKKVQLDAIDSDIKLLLCVINSSPIVALNTKKDFESHAKFLYEMLNWKGEYYIGILTGKCDINGVSDDIIYPKLNK